jgi:DnaD/phage-associated family protein
MDMNKATDDGIQETIQLPGEGYQAPLEIHPQTTVIRRRGWEMVEEVVPAFVKISTAFKSELKDIDGTALKVWIFLALSINRNTEEAHPGVRTISAACDLAQNTVTAAIKKLEGRGLLTVNREDKKYNIYRIPEFVSANSKSASKNEAIQQTASIDEQTASIPGQSASVESESASIALRLNQINQSNQREQEYTTTRGNFGEVFKAYEAEIGLLTPHIRDSINDYLDALHIPAGWIIESFHIAAENSKHNWAYCQAILKRWSVEGKTALPPKEKPYGPKYPGRRKGNAQPEWTPEAMAKAQESAAKELMPCHQS